MVLDIRASRLAEAAPTRRAPRSGGLKAVAADERFIPRFTRGVEGVREVGWSTGSVALVVTGGMLITVVIASLHPRVALSARSRTVFLSGAAVFIGFAVLAEHVVNVALPPVVLALPLVPLAVGVVLARDAWADARARRGPAGTHRQRVAPFGAPGMGTDWMLAGSPYATAAELADLAHARPELRPAIAANPAAPASLLQWLADQGEPAVLEAISSRRPLAG